MRRSVYHATKVIGRALWVRFHIALILAGVGLVGLVANWAALRGGVDAMAIRYPIGVLVGYLAFFAGVKLWLAYAESALGAAATTEIARLEEQPDRPPIAAPASCRAWWERLDLGLPDVGDGEGCLVVAILLVAAVVLFGVGAFVMTEMPVILAEAFVQVALVAALRRRAKLIGAPHWSGPVLRATWVPAFSVLVAASLVGWAAQRHCPTAIHLMDALWRCPR